MNGPPSVSVVIPVLDGASTVGDTLRALLAQSGAPADREVIVVDNGSTDGTPDVVRQFDVTLLEESRRGPAAARNRGLRAARGEVIAHLDADTLPTRRWLAEITAPFADPMVHLAAGETVNFRSDSALDRYYARSGLFDSKSNIHREVMPFAASGNMAVRRSSALAIDGWNDEMITAEDVDFSHRLLRRFRSEIAYRPAAVLFHRNGGTREELRRQAWRYGEGAADLYRRYPDVLPWGTRQYLHLVRNLASHGIAPALLGVGRRLGIASPEDVEYAEYHWLWSRTFWRGFFSMYRGGERRRPA